MPSLREPVAAGNELLQHDSLARSAANWIAEHIISGDIKPGEKLTETGLAERMGVSRSPVREALQALSREGLIILEPRRGARVDRLDAGDMADLYACRLLIEPRCTAAFERMVAAVAAYDPAEYVDALRHYNGTVLAACPNRPLSGYAQSSWRSSLRYWDLLVRGAETYLTESLERNKRLHEAILAQAAPGIECAAIEILEHGRDELLRILNQFAAGQEPIDSPS
jgi:DNA-binding GntR family transcriptional regulator